VNVLYVFKVMTRLRAKRKGSWKRLKGEDEQ
jgi:hypothetical protein